MSGEIRDSLPQDFVQPECFPLNLLASRARVI